MNLTLINFSNPIFILNSLPHLSHISPKTIWNVGIFKILKIITELPIKTVDSVDDWLSH